MRKIKRGRKSGYAVWKNRDWLKEKYLYEHLSIAQIAEEVGVEAPTIAYWLKKHDIKTRSISRAKEGTHHSEETKQKISASMKNKKVENK